MALPNSNYTQFPNEILDNLHFLSGSELKVISAICRHTLGFHQKKKRMSISFLMEKTGLSNRSVIDACDSLTDRGWIDEFKSRQGNEYSIKLECPDVKKAHKQKSEDVKKVHNGCEKSSQPDMKFFHTYKENKETCETKVSIKENLLVVSPTSFDLASPTLTGDPGLTALDGGSQPGSATALVGEIGSEDRSPANARIAERGMGQELDINKNPLPLPPPPQPEVVMTLADELIRRSIALCKKTESRLAPYQRKAIRAYPELARNAVVDLAGEIEQDNTKNAAQCLGMLLREYLGDRMNEFVKTKKMSAAKAKKTSSTKVEKQDKPIVQDEVETASEIKPWIPEIGEQVYHPKLGVFTVRCRGKAEGGLILLMPNTQKEIETKKAIGESTPKVLLRECSPIEAVAAGLA